jgi:hypothetical protein
MVDWERNRVLCVVGGGSILKRLADALLLPDLGSSSEKTGPDVSGEELAMPTEKGPEPFEEESE